MADIIARRVRRLRALARPSASATGQLIALGAIAGIPVSGCALTSCLCRALKQAVRCIGCGLGGERDGNTVGPIGDHNALLGINLARD